MRDTVNPYAPPQSGAESSDPMEDELSDLLDASGGARGWHDRWSNTRVVSARG